MDTISYLENLEEIKNSSFLKNIFKFLILGNRQMHLVNINNVIDSINFVIEKDFDNTKELFIVSQDYDPNNTYKNIFIYAYKKIHNKCRSYSKANHVSKRV